MYKVGMETRATIIKTAKALMYESGYRGVTVTKICTACNEKLGTFTYYFNKKEDLIKYLYDDYMRNCMEYVANNTENLSMAESQIFTVMLYYRNIYRDPNLVRFHKEIYENGTMVHVYSNPANVIQSFTAQYGRSKQYYDLLVVADNAVRRELNINFIKEGRYDCDAVKKLIEDIYFVSGRLFDIKDIDVNRYINKAYQFVLEHNDCDITLL